MHRTLRWASVLAYVMVLTMLLVRKLSEMPIMLFPHADKVAHFVAFGLLGMLLLRAMTNPRSEKPSIWVQVGAIVIPIGYAVLMEFVQVRVGRDFSIGDMAAGASGIVVVTVLWVHLRKRFILIR